MTTSPTLLNLLSANNIIIYMLVFTRITGLFQSAPFFSTIKMPIMTKVWFGATVAFIFYPMVQGTKAYIIPKDMVEFSILLFFEFLIGYLIGFVANLIIEGVRMSGNILSVQMGLSMSEALDPATGVNSTEISRLYVYLVTLIFLATGAYQMLFVTIFNSFTALPMGFINVFNSNMITSMLLLFGGLFKISFGICLPIFSVLLISDILLGVMSKMMPQINIYMVSLPVKIYMGLFLMLAFLQATSVYIQKIIQEYFEVMVRIFT